MRGVPRRRAPRRGRAGPRLSGVPGRPEGERASWSDALRGAPTGVVVLGTLLLFLAAGCVVGGAYLGLARGGAGWVAWATALVAGPVILYLALHLVRLSRWAWQALVGMLLLLLASSAARAIGDAGFPIAPLVEIAAEATALAYLLRPGVRGAFGRRQRPLSR